MTKLVYFLLVIFVVQVVVESAPAYTYAEGSDEDWRKKIPEGLRHEISEVLGGSAVLPVERILKEVFYNIIRENLAQRSTYYPGPVGPDWLDILKTIGRMLLEP